MRPSGEPKGPLAKMTDMTAYGIEERNGKKKQVVCDYFHKESLLYNFNEIVLQVVILNLSEIKGKLGIHRTY